jgi:hypothetical protein
MKIVQIQVRNKFGNDNIYSECPTGRLFAELTGKCTFSVNDLKVIEKLGFKVDVISAKPVIKGFN